MRSFLILLAGLLLLGSVPAHAQTTATEFDWQKSWGKIDFSSDNDPVIPASHLAPKSDIKTAISTCGTQNADLTSIATYNVDFDGDGKPDYIVDASGYFQQYANPATCQTGDAQICTAADGCYLTIYLAGQDTNIITASPTNPQPTCPATAAQNTSCLSNCAATEQNCPSAFMYNTRGLFEQRVKSWRIMTVTDFTNWAEGANYQVRNTNPVLAVTMNNSNCYNTELAANNNQCIKYYQYDSSVDGGEFVDLFDYENPTTGEFDTRYTTSPFSRTIARMARGEAMGSGFGHKLASNSTLDIQFASFVRTNKDGSKAPAAFASFHITNTSGRDYFVPANSDFEFSAFLNSTQTGVTVVPEELQFTPWVGETVCPPQNTIPAGSSITISAQRFCQSSTSAYRACGTCVDAQVSTWEQGCVMNQVCSGPPASFCVGRCGGGGHDCFAGGTLITLADGSSKPIEQIKAGDMIMGFTKLQGALKAYKVKTIAVTPAQVLMSINGELTMTGDHRLVTDKGRKIRAAKLKPGIVLLRGDGTKLTVTTLQTVPEKATVYNLQLDKGGVGFIADGLRVLDYR